MTELDGYNLVGGGQKFTVTANYIYHLDDVNNRPQTITRSTSLILFDANGMSSYAMTKGKFLMILVKILTNTNAGTTVIKWMKNGAVIGTGITFAATETGEKEIIEEIDFALGDQLQINFEMNGVGSIDFEKFTIIANFEEV